MGEIYVTDCTKHINIGKQGENEAVAVLFPTADWISTFGEGTFYCFHQRPVADEDETVYPVTLDTETYSGYVAWIVTNTDVENAGFGACELQLIIDDTIAKSRTWSTLIEASLGESGEAPEPGESWIEKFIEAAEEIIDTATEDAEAAAAAANASAEAANASETNAAAFETNASTHANAAAASASNAAASAVSAANYANNAAESANSASDYANNASSYANNAAESANNAAASESNASTHANAAAESADNAAESEANAANAAEIVVEERLENLYFSINTDDYGLDITVEDEE